MAKLKYRLFVPTANCIHAPEFDAKKFTTVENCLECDVIAGLPLGSYQDCPYRRLPDKLMKLKYGEHWDSIYLFGSEDGLG